MKQTPDSTVQELRSELHRTRQQVADLSRRLDSLARAVRFSAGLMVETITEPATPYFD